MKKLNKSDDNKALAIVKRLKMIRKLGGKCEKCGCEEPECLDFHHLIDKNDEIARLKYSRMSILEKEVEKCILLCANCHSELHYENSRNGQNRHNVLKSLNRTRCEECKYSGENLSSLDFHHKDPFQKDFGISQFACRQVSVNIQKLEDELNKCEVLCRNCHRKRHFDYKFYKENKYIIEQKIKNHKEIQSKINRKKIIELYEKGRTQKEIRELLNCSKGTISGIFQELGIRKERKRKTYTKNCKQCGIEFVTHKKKQKHCSFECGNKKSDLPSVEELKKLKILNTYKEIGDMFGVSTVAVWNKINKIHN